MGDAASTPPPPEEATLPQGVDDLAAAAESSRGPARLETSLEAPVVPGYVLAERLGRGTFGEVWRGVQSRTGQPVAVKILVRRTGTELLQARRELARLRRVAEHPSVVSLIDADLDHDPPFLVTSLVIRGSLDRQGLRGGDAREVEQAARWFEEVVRALQSVHRKGVLHCDLKPGNILVDEDGAARLVDFGQAWLAGEDRASLGTLWYMAPEHARALDDEGVLPDVAWDVYSLGATFYWLLTGQAPRASEEARESLDGLPDPRSRLRRYSELATGPLAPVRGLNPRVDRELAAILERCLEGDPARRYPDAASILEDLVRRGERAPVEEAWLGLLAPGVEAGVLLSVVGGMAILGAPAAAVGAWLSGVALWFGRRYGLLDFLLRVRRGEVTDLRSPVVFAVIGWILVALVLTLTWEYQVEQGYDRLQGHLGRNAWGQAGFLSRFFVAGFSTSLVLRVLSAGLDPRVTLSRTRLLTAGLLLLLAAVLLMGTAT